MCPVNFEMMSGALTIHKKNEGYNINTLPPPPPPARKLFIHQEGLGHFLERIRQKCVSLSHSFAGLTERSGFIQFRFSGPRPWRC